MIQLLRQLLFQLQHPPILALSVYQLQSVDPLELATLPMQVQDFGFAVIVVLKAPMGVNQDQLNRLA